MSSAERSPEPTPARPSTDTPVAAGVEGDPAVSVLAGLLWEALRELGNAGEPERANRIGGRAWSALRRRDAKAAHKINGLMHRLARQEAALVAAGRDPARED